MLFIIIDNVTFYIIQIAQTTNMFITRKLQQLDIFFIKIFNSNLCPEYAKYYKIIIKEMMLEASHFIFNF